MNISPAPVASIVEHCAPGFGPVVDAFRANFAREDDYSELGAAFCVVQSGKVVVNLAGGRRHSDAPGDWQADTLVNVFSTGKGLVALAIALLVEEGVLDYEQSVAHYWPEFAAHGKGSISVAELLSHQAGLAGFKEQLAPAALYDRPLLTAKLAAQAPFHTAGEATCYHPMTFGYLADELVRRASGAGLRQLVRQRFQEGLGLDLYIGCPASERDRLASLAEPPVAELALPAELSDAARAALSNPQIEAAWANSEAWRDAELPAANVHASALALAKLYSILASGGTFGERKMLGAGTIEQLCAVRSSRQDQLLQLPMQWCAGLIRNTAGLYGPAENSFGHSGWGGSFACADVEHDVAMAYVCNRMGAELVGDPRTQGLCASVYRCLAA